MKTIHYAGGEVLTSDDVADAVVDYAAALAKAGSSAELTIPVLLSDGSTSEASMLLGPASQLVAQPEPGTDVDLDDKALLIDVRDKAAALGPSRAEPTDAPMLPGIDEFGLE
jgi:hypothetical protein